MRTLVLCFIALAMSRLSFSQDARTKQVLDRYEHLRPDAGQLTMYGLDWSSSLSDALRRATAEGRPVALIIIHAKYGNILSGHC